MIAFLCKHMSNFVHVQLTKGIHDEDGNPLNSDTINLLDAIELSWKISSNNPNNDELNERCHKFIEDLARLL